MTNTTDRARVVIMDALTRLGVDLGALRRYRVVSDGMSGSRVFRVWCDGEAWVLKTSAAGGVVQERARREIAFYRAVASGLSVATPTVLASVSDARGSAVLLAAYDAVEPPQRWRERQYIEVAADLARLHSRYWNTTDALAAYPWLQRFTDDAVPVADVRDAWRPLQGRLRTVGWDEPSLAQWLTTATHGLNTLAERSRDVPVTLCHGDCHAGNLLRTTDGQFVWSDWQEVGIGYGPRDLSFFIQRALADGGAVPEPAMLRAYHTQLEEALESRLSLHALAQAADAAELYTRLLHWPAYLASAPDHDIAMHLQRIELVLSRSRGDR